MTILRLLHKDVNEKNYVKYKERLRIIHLNNIKYTYMIINLNVIELNSIVIIFLSDLSERISKNI